ncbi:MAG: ATPase [Microcoleus sp. PH2017_12_PCY_D_A]|uniref:NB-ARC domain-containing protein n=1 Tax=Microcoleus sp. PH2017_12_PCY_D_A TaxID=2798823 RepID=UPI001DEC8097|nr:NB-ARC domain-containing protein [Microcoleus sp. PH2017_12_PCY_D_A]MCC3481768.1 ATPase [Microcoleus sp. PH2017_12_PCY_D_A]
MEVQEVLKIADDIVFAKTGKHLNHLQEGILRGTWQRQKYPEIAKTCYRSEAHVKKVAAKLWKLLSQTLGEDINQSNFRYTVERLQLSIVESNFGNYYAQIDNFSVCENKSHLSEIPNTEKPNQPLYNQTKPKERLDLSDAPEPNIFYNRTSELNGLSGIGKTALTLQLIPEIQHEFDYIIYRSLRNSPPLQTLQTDLIQFLCRGGAPVPAPAEERAPTGGLPLQYLRSHRCLIILDDIQTIFSSGQLAGNYQPGYENYGTFFKQIAESSHNSCLILLSWEKPREIAALEGENRPCKSLQLKGLGPEAQEIFREKGLAEPEKWSELIDLYRGNPLWLNIIATLIQDLFGGSVSEFLSYDTLFLGDLESLLEQQCDRLTEPEKQVISSLASEAAPVEISKISAHLELSPSALLQAVQSLGRRLLIEKVKQGQKTLFTLQPVLIEYLKNQH